MPIFAFASSVDVILIIAAILQFVLAESIFRRVAKRDHDFAPRFEAFRAALAEATRERNAKAGPSPAE